MSEWKTTCITPMLGAATAPGYLRRRLKFLHAQT